MNPRVHTMLHVLQLQNKQQQKSNKYRRKISKRRKREKITDAHDETCHKYHICFIMPIISMSRAQHACKTCTHKCMQNMHAQMHAKHAYKNMHTKMPLAYAIVGLGLGLGFGFGVWVWVRIRVCVPRFCDPCQWDREWARASPRWPQCGCPETSAQPLQEVRACPPQRVNARQE